MIGELVHELRSAEGGEDLDFMSSACPLRVRSQISHLSSEEVVVIILRNLQPDLERERLAGILHAVQIYRAQTGHHRVGLPSFQDFRIRSRNRTRELVIDLIREDAGKFQVVDRQIMNELREEGDQMSDRQHRAPAERQFGELKSS